MHSTDLIFHLLVYKSICSEMGVKDAKHQRPKSLTPISGQIQYSQANEGLFVDPSSRSANLICSKNLICDRMLASNNHVTKSYDSSVLCFPTINLRGRKRKKYFSFSLLWCIMLVTDISNDKS